MSISRKMHSSSLTSRNIPSVTSSVTSLPTIQYRRALSNPLWRDKVYNKMMEYENRLTQSVPKDIDSKYKTKLRENRPSEIDVQLSDALLKALMKRNKKLSGFSNKSFDTAGYLNIEEEEKFKSKKPIKQPKQHKIYSIDTPTIINSDVSVNTGEIIAEDEYPLYRLLNEAITDIAVILGNQVLKKNTKAARRLSSTKSSINEDVYSLITEKLSDNGELTPSQAHFISKSMTVALRPLPDSVSRSLKSKCSLWKLKGSIEGSLKTSLSVNPSSSNPKDEITENGKLGIDDDDIQETIKPNNNMILINQLMKECTADKTYYRLLKKRMFPFSFNIKDYKKIYKPQIANQKFKMFKLTGSDMITLNRRTTMMRLSYAIYRQHLANVKKHHQMLCENEKRRIRNLMIQGYVPNSYEETDDSRNKWRTTEKPHIAYNSLKPIFNENPLAVNYKALFKSVHRNVVLKDKEESEVASIGQVSFVSDSSSLGNPYTDEYTAENTQSNLPDVNKNIKYEQSKNETCNLFMMAIKENIHTIEDANSLENLFKIAEPLIHPPKTN